MTPSARPFTIIRLTEHCPSITVRTNRAIFIVTKNIRVVKLSDAVARDGKVLYGVPKVFPSGRNVQMRRAFNDLCIVTLKVPGIYFVEGQYNLIYSCG